MPIYAFECSACGHDFDRLQKLSDPDPTDCPQCGAPKVQRRLTAPQFRLAGGGWYETDFKKDGEKKRNLVEGAGGSKDSGGGSGGNSGASEAKPAASSGGGSASSSGGTGSSGASSSG